ncbi:MAG: divalent-cation tolerance protein CutA [Planctomycetota bacterium]|jgi:periplasmic divalent cation tolerance protein
MSEFLSVYVTAGGLDEAERIGAALVEERLVACANVLPGVRSIYRWEGSVERDDEVALILKTRAELFDAVQARVTELHDYDVPCIVAWPIERVSEDYGRWLSDALDAD